jgi:hypothetical protein
VAAREQELLPVGYVHVVFTMPEVLARLALVNKRVVYDLLFKASAATLRQVAANRQRLGAALGGLMVLHTWGQRLQHHPHIHCVVPAGGLSSEGARWVHARPRFFLPIPVLRQVYRGKLVAGLRDAFRDGRLSFPGALAPLATESAFRSFLRSLYRQRWVVYAKPPFGSPAHVLHYLARYTHRVAISNHRLVAVTDNTVSFRWKDYRHGARCARSPSMPTSFSGAFSFTYCRNDSSEFATLASWRRGVAPTISRSVGRRWLSRPCLPRRRRPSHRRRGARGRVRAVARPCGSSND